MCYNTAGSYICICDPGYTSSGDECTGKYDLISICTSKIASCVDSSDYSITMNSLVMYKSSKRFSSMIKSNDSIQSYSYDSNPVVTVFARGLSNYERSG